MLIPINLFGSDRGTAMYKVNGQPQDLQLPFLQELIDDNATIAADIAEIGTHTWAIHGVIPVDGDVIMAEFATYAEARVVLDQLSIHGSRTD